MLLVLPVCPLDKDQGFELLRLWADLEDSFNQSIEVAICLRFDMDESCIPQRLIDYVSNKFKVHTHVSKRKHTGWPAGCNAIELDAYEWFVEANRNKIFDIPYMLIAESDTTPLRKGWANEIMNESYDCGRMISGCMLFVPDCGCEHINGNCVMHRDLWREYKGIFHCPSQIGWDAYIRTYAVGRGFASRLIWQDYRLGMPDNPWKGDNYLWEDKFVKSTKHPYFGKPLRPCVLHGTKTLDGIRAVRRRVLGEVVA